LNTALAPAAIVIFIGSASGTAGVQRSLGVYGPIVRYLIFIGVIWPAWVEAAESLDGDFSGCRISRIIGTGVALIGSLM